MPTIAIGYQPRQGRRAPPDPSNKEQAVNATPSLTDIPDKGALARFHDDFGPRFMLTVDIEEEFDWNAPFLRSGHSLGHVARLRKFQQFCEGAGVVPVYLIAYPVATSPLAAEILREPLAAGRAAPYWVGEGRSLLELPLTPEGITAAEAIRGIDRALDENLPLLVFNFHSPSLEPGHTPYVRNTNVH